MENIWLLMHRENLCMAAWALGPGGENNWLLMHRENLCVAALALGPRGESNWLLMHRKTYARLHWLAAREGK